MYNLIVIGVLETSEWVIKFNSLLGTADPCSPYKLCNYNLYIGIIIFPHIVNTQSTGCAWNKTDEWAKFVKL